MRLVNGSIHKAADFKSLIVVQEHPEGPGDELISKIQKEASIVSHGVTCTKFITEKGIEEGIFSGNEDADSIEISHEKSLVVCLSDTFLSPKSLLLNKQLQHQEHALLNVTVNENEVIVGPLVRFNETACLACANAQVQYFNFSFRTSEKVTTNRDDITQKVAQIIASLWTPESVINHGGCFTMEGDSWVLLSNTLKNPNCPVCSRWSHTPKEVFYS